MEENFFFFSDPLKMNKKKLNHYVLLLNFFLFIFTSKPKMYLFSRLIHYKEKISKETNIHRETHIQHIIKNCIYFKMKIINRKDSMYVMVTLQECGTFPMAYCMSLFHAYPFFQLFFGVHYMSMSSDRRKKLKNWDYLKLK